jgi:ubiquinone/menaquinone biosynthesis C-methylase UbiE
VMRRSFLAVLLFLTIHAHSQDQWKNVYSESAWAGRDSWQKPGAILKQLGCKTGSRVADVGCHEGYMTIKLSKVVGPAGTVYAVDVDQSKLDKLKGHLEARQLSNVMSLKGNPDDPRLPAGMLDAVMILDAYHEMKDHDKILHHIWVSLKPGGRLVICEPIADARRKLVREEQERKHELGLSFALDDLKKAGFTILFKQDPFVDREKIKGDKMWIVVAIPNGSRQ